MNCRLVMGLSVSIWLAWGCSRTTPSVSGTAPAELRESRGADDRALEMANGRSGRLVILGFDGVDPRWLERWARDGELPTIKMLMNQHGGRGYHALGSTNPPQSPVAWTTFATGTLPSDHGIFDFVARTHSSNRTGPPVGFAVSTTSLELHPSGPPVASNLRTGLPFWQALDNDGVRVVVLNVPYSFPPDPMRFGRMLSGLGVPDLRETNSTFTYAATDVTDAQHTHSPAGGVMVKLVVKDGVGRFALEGPSIPGGEGARMSLPVEIRPGDHGHMSIKIARKLYSVPLQSFSDLIEVEFSHGSSRVQGLLRLLPLELGRRTRLFITPISLDPHEPYLSISHPHAFSGQLADLLGGAYKTVGWDHDTSALNAELIDEGAFLKDMDSVERDRRRMLDLQLETGDYDLLIWVSTATDRVAHMFYRLIDPDHPRYDAALAERYGDAILNEYRRMDRTIASTLEKLSSQDTLLVVSDHGFHNFRRGLHTNQWLRSQGLLALRNGQTSTQRELLVEVDWSATKAYAVGTGQIYLNLKGRERDGIVSSSDVKELTAQIRTGLMELRDQERGGAIVVRNVYYARDNVRGPHGADAPDLQIGFAENYRTSWETILGGVPAGLFADNQKKWSGDHAASDASETPGVILANRPLDKQDPHIADIAPTALAFFRRNVPEHYAGRPLFGAMLPVD